jgi:rRNA maturation RNase YbeY
MGEIRFFSEKITFSLQNPGKISAWIKKCIQALDKEPANLNYIFTSDDNLLNINKLYLNHDYYTDIITFDNSGNIKEIEGDIFISAERVKENANQYGVSFEEELARVMIHGILHLAGYDDKTKEEKALMRQMENKFLSDYKKN